MSSDPFTAADASAKSQPEKEKDFVTEEHLKLFPERRGGYKEKSFLGKVFTGNHDHWRNKCERNVLQAVENAPLVKLMMSALRSQGCPVDVRRHISCEYCASGVTGGYDPQFNQIVVCHNSSTSQTVQGILAHEMLHMFDHCRAYMDFSNVEHVACSEIRAANLFHCSILSGLFSGTVTPVSLSRAHERCVKQKALASVLTSFPDLDKRESVRIILKVFDKCYNDLEPVGRRVRARSKDPDRAYRERFLYGYD